MPLSGRTMPRQSTTESGSQAAALLYAGGLRELTSSPTYVVIARTVFLIEEVSCALFKR